MLNMCVFGRSSVLIVLVLVGVLWWPNDAGTPTKWKANISVKNSLGGNMGLNVYCPHIDPKQHFLGTGAYYEWVYSGGIPSPGETPFLCYFTWQGASHSTDLCVPDKDTGCEFADWEIKLNGLCRYFGAGPGAYVCYKWNN
ncbi:hypothetical protein D0Y65_025302 [Glycine soja]|uniref:Uncharacterized protein n=2 Tax=Glycine soja TaxID=3848 RepID=A0A445J6K3_GLYSO|nr:hypothetical protein D0Y65_025302 [Glycine soja]